MKVMIMKIVFCILWPIAVIGIIAFSYVAVYCMGRTQGRIEEYENNFDFNERD